MGSSELDAAIKGLHQSTRSNVPVMLFNLAAVAGGAASICTGWPTVHPLWIAAVVLWIAYFQHCWTIIFHEDVHFSLYPNARWHNVLNGSIISLLVMVPFNVFRQVHLRHHSKMNSPEDGELWPYVEPRTSVGFRRLFLVVDLILGLWAAPFIYNRVFFLRDTHIRDPKLRRRIWMEFAGITVFWACLLGFVTWKGYWYEFALAYLIPAWLTGMIQTGRKLVEHLGLPAGDPMLGARTVLARDIVGRVAAETSFHISAHGLHHKYPQMPHENLEQALAAAGTIEQGTVFPSYWRALKDMLPHLRYPGIGVNARPRAEIVGEGFAVAQTGT